MVSASFIAGENSFDELGVGVYQPGGKRGQSDRVGRGTWSLSFFLGRARHFRLGIEKRAHHADSRNAIGQAVVQAE